MLNWFRVWKCFGLVRIFFEKCFYMCHSLSSTNDTLIISYKIRKGLKAMFIVLFILVWGIPLLKESIENEQYRQECYRRGDTTYWSTTGCRYTHNNAKVYR